MFGIVYCLAGIAALGGVELLLAALKGKQVTLSREQMAGIRARILEEPISEHTKEHMTELIDVQGRQVEGMKKLTVSLVELMSMFCWLPIAIGISMAYIGTSGFRAIPDPAPHPVPRGPPAPAAPVPPG